MIYTRDIISDGQITIKRYAYHSLSGDELQTYKSVQVTFKAMCTGVIKVSGMLTFRQQGQNNIYLGTTNKIDPNTGIPLEYLATGVDEFTFNVTADTQYVATIQGTTTIYTNPSTLWIKAEYISYEYSPIGLPTINNFYGDRVIKFNAYNPFRLNQVYVIPIKLIYPMGFSFYCPSSNTHPTSTYVTISQSYKGIDPTTGTPKSSSGPYYPMTDLDHAKNQSAWINTNLVVQFLYVRFDAIPEGYDLDNFCIGISTNNNPIYSPTTPTSTTVTAEVVDRDGNIQGSYFDYTVNSAYNHYIGQGVAPGDYLGNERVLAWRPMNLTIPTGYERLKFVGWYADANHTQLITTDPEYRFCPLNTSYTFYGLVEGANEFNFTTTIAPGEPFAIPHTEWNDFITYCISKCNGDDLCGYQYYERELKSDAFRQSGQSLPADTFNRIKYYLDQHTTPLEPYNYVNVGDYIQASYINNLVQEAKNI